MAATLTAKRELKKLQNIAKRINEEVGNVTINIDDEHLFIDTDEGLELVVTIDDEGETSIYGNGGEFTTTREEIDDLVRIYNIVKNC